MKPYESALPIVSSQAGSVACKVVDAGMCRAQGIPHQKVSRCEELQPALHSAWALHRHSVVEVITGRDSNVDQHRQLQTAVQHAVKHGMKLLSHSMSGQCFGCCMLLEWAQGEGGGNRGAALQPYVAQNFFF